MKKKILISITILLVVIIGIVLSFCKCSGKTTPTPTYNDSIFESVVGSDVNYIDRWFGDNIEHHFYEVRAYMKNRIDSAVINNEPIDSITTIFAVGDKVWFFGHKIVDGVVKTDTMVCGGPFVEDMDIEWPLKTTFSDLRETIRTHKLNCPNKDIVLRRALIWHPKDYADWTIYAGDKKFWFISTENDSIRDVQ